MSFNKSIITTFSLDQRQEFLTVLKKKNKRGDVKNIELFYLLCEDKIYKHYDIELYGKPNKGAYHAVSKRLNDSLIEYIAGNSLEKENSKEMEVLKLLVSANYFFEHDYAALAFKVLKKAEIKSKKQAMFHFLNEIYLLKIQNIHKNSVLSFEEVLNDYNANKLEQQSEESLMLFYATMQYELENLNTKPLEVLISNLNKFSISISNGLSYTALLKITEICNTVAHSTSNHAGLWKFIGNSLVLLEQKGNGLDRSLSDHIQLLFYLANFNFRLRHFEISDSYLESMHQLMLLDQKKFYKIFRMKYQLLKALNQIFSGKLKPALDTLVSVENYNIKEGNVYDLLLTKVIALFFNREIKEAYRIYRNFYHSDIWYSKKVGKVWVIQKNLIELVLLVELDEYDLFTSRLDSFRKKHNKLLTEFNEGRVLEYLKLITVYYKNAEVVLDMEFQNRVNALLGDLNEEQDLFVVSFYAWLKAKIIKKDVYEVCLKAIVDIES